MGGYCENCDFLLNEFITYLQLEKNCSEHTITSYKKDLVGFFMFMDEQAIADVGEVNYQDARLFLTKLYKERYAKKTVARKISCIRSFYRFLLRESYVNTNPFAQVSLPKLENNFQNFL